MHKERAPTRLPASQGKGRPCARETLHARRTTRPSTPVLYQGDEGRKVASACVRSRLTVLLAADLSVWHLTRVLLAVWLLLYLTILFGSLKPIDRTILAPAILIPQETVDFRNKRKLALIDDHSLKRRSFQAFDQGQAHYGQVEHGFVQGPKLGVKLCWGRDNLQDMNIRCSLRKKQRKAPL